MDRIVIEFANWTGLGRARASANALAMPSRFFAAGPSEQISRRSHSNSACPANDGFPAASGKGAMRSDSLFWLDLVEIDGLVLLASRLKFGLEAFRALRRERGARAAQLAVNTVFLNEFFDVENYSTQTLTAFGHVVCDCLHARAERDFPGHSFIAELVTTGDEGRIEIRLYQEIHPDEESKAGEDANAI